MNPFEGHFDSWCRGCECEMYEGSMVYAHDDLFLCSDCAEEENVVCECGKYKKPEYSQCYDCNHKDITTLKDFRNA